MYAKYAKRRDELHMTDFSVANETGIAPSTISDWKNGKSTPKMDKLVKIAKLLNVPLEFFIE
jgi:repressor LexA